MSGTIFTVIDSVIRTTSFSNEPRSMARAGPPPTVVAINEVDPSVTPAGGYLPLSLLGVPPIVIGDEEIVQPLLAQFNIKLDNLPPNISKL